jgi:hypothetical protein
MNCNSTVPETLVSSTSRLSRESASGQPSEQPHAHRNNRFPVAFEVTMSCETPRIMRCLHEVEVILATCDSLLRELRSNQLRLRQKEHAIAQM